MRTAIEVALAETISSCPLEFDTNGVVVGEGCEIGREETSGIIKEGCCGECYALRAAISENK